MTLNDKLYLEGDGILSNFWGGRYFVKTDTNEKLLFNDKDERIANNVGIREIKIIPFSKYALVTGFDLKNGHIIDNDGNVVLSGKLNLYTYNTKRYKDDRYTLIYSYEDESLYGVRRTSISKIIAPGGQTKFVPSPKGLCITSHDSPYLNRNDKMYPVFINAKTPLGYIFGDNYKIINEPFRSRYNIMNDRLVGFENEETRKSIIYDVRDKNFIIKTPCSFSSRVVEIGSLKLEFLFAKDENNCYAFSCLTPTMWQPLDKIDIYYEGEKCVNIGRDECIEDLYVAESESGKLGLIFPSIINTNIDIWCDDYRVSGVLYDDGYNHIGYDKRKENNIIYYKNDGVWRMAIMSNREASSSDTYQIYKGTFDAVYYLGSKVNVIRKGDKETFVVDAYGIYSTNEEGEPIWYDECYPVDFDDFKEEGNLYAKVDGEKKLIGNVHRERIWI